MDGGEFAAREKPACALTPIQLRLGACSAKAPYPSPIKGEEEEQKKNFPTRAKFALSYRMEQHRTPSAAPESASSPSAPARAPRPRAEYRWTPDKAHAFIEALARHGKVAAAARAVGMTRQSAYRLKHRMPMVADVWARAQAVGRKRRLAGASVTRRSGQGDTSGSAK